MTPDELRRSLERELADLETTQRPRLLVLMGSVDGRDPADRADLTLRELDLVQLDERITRLRDRLTALDERPARTGPASGTSVVVDFGDGPETYRLADFSLGDERVITANSPLGRALAGAHSGQTVTYRTPRGLATVTLVAVGEDGGPVEGAGEGDAA